MLKNADQHTLAARVEACHGPAWVIDAAASEVIAANTAGAELLGLGTSASSRLDATMPAMVRLAELARRPAAATTVCDNLVFWTARGAVHLACRIEPMKQKGRGRLMLVETVDRVPKAPDDAVTLRRIADSIRNGNQPTSPTIPVNDTEGAGAAEQPETPEAAAKVAHEIKTPLSAIAAAAEIMKEERLGPIGNDRYREYAADIFECAEHALAVIDRLLGTPRDAGERTEFVFAEVDMNEIAEGAASAVEPLAAAQGISLTTDLASRLPRVVADATSLRQILFNLITNALKFTASGGSITVATRHVLDGPVTIAVSDTGEGMTREAVERALNSSARPRARARFITSTGLGLGLPTALALSEANGASLTIESTPGRGTTVTVTFRKSRVIPV